jgi:sugar phosphate isomerase/epimerase
MNAAQPMPAIGLGCATLMHASLIELIETAARHGFPTITVPPGRYATVIDQGETQATLRRRLADAGLRVTMVDALTQGLPGLGMPQPADSGLRASLPPDVFVPPDQEACFRAAEALEAPWINVTHFGGRPVPFAIMRDAIGAICRRAGTRGLGVTIEFVPGTGIPDLAYASAIATECGEPNCRVTLDPWHLDRSSGTVEDVRRLPPGMIAGMQLCDRIPEPPGAPLKMMADRLMPGEGRLPLAALLEAALANSPALSLEVEVISAELRALPFDEAAARVSAGLAAWQTAVGLS